MTTNEMTGEQISAFADGESSDAQIELALASLRQPEGKTAWDIYHQIGDVLRSDDMAVSLSAGFAERMAARLDAEPTIIVPAIANNGHTFTKHAASQSPASSTRAIKRWAMPGAVAAVAAAAAAFFATPQLMVALKGESPVAVAQPTVASAVVSGKAEGSTSDTEQGAVIAASVAEGVVLRDSRIDDYLLAHQRLSPSVFSTAQYARSATFASDSNK